MIRVFEAEPDGDYELLDSGGARKLERFGEVVLERPDPQALWRPRLAPDEWSRRADLVFVRESDRGGRWESARRGPVPDRWTARLAGVELVVRPTRFKHVGVFPEQAGNWDWIAGLARGLGAQRPRLLNLFGYTGVASVLAARAGFDVTHVDASKASLAWARENAELAGVADGMRVLLEDALAFARREVRRGARYGAILLDPPHYGRGPKGEKWQLEEGLAPLVEACGELLEERAALVLSIYAVGYSPLALAGLLEELAGGELEVGELALREAAAGDAPRRLLPCGFCGRWWRGVERPG